MNTNNRTSPGRPARRRIAVRFLASAYGITARRIVQAVAAALAERDCHTISVVIVDDADISELHEHYLNDPAPTDVLAFDLRDDPVDERIEGEIIVSAETAARQARRFRSSPAQELLRYAIHGTLHLTGHDDGTPTGRARMRRAENRILASLMKTGHGEGQPRTGGPRSREKPGRTTRSVRR